MEVEAGKRGRAVQRQMVPTPEHEHEASHIYIEMRFANCSLCLPYLLVPIP
jgi:hypothetical protein